MNKHQAEIARVHVLEAQARLTRVKDLLDRSGVPTSDTDAYELVNQLDFVVQYAGELSNLLNGQPPDEQFWSSLATD